MVTVIHAHGQGTVDFGMVRCQVARYGIAGYGETGQGKYLNMNAIIL